MLVTIGSILCFMLVIRTTFFRTLFRAFVRAFLVTTLSFVRIIACIIFSSVAAVFIIAGLTAGICGSIRKRGPVVFILSLGVSILRIFRQTILVGQSSCVHMFDVFFRMFF